MLCGETRCSTLSYHEKILKAWMKNRCEICLRCVVFVRLNASYHHCIEKGFTKLMDPREERRQLSKPIEKFITCC